MKGPSRITDKEDPFEKKLQKMGAQNTGYTYKPTYYLKEGGLTHFIYYDTESYPPVTMWTTKISIGDKPWQQTSEKVGETIHISCDECLKKLGKK